MFQIASTEIWLILKVLKSQNRANFQKTLYQVCWSQLCHDSSVQLHHCPLHHHLDSQQLPSMMPASRSRRLPPHLRMCPCLWSVIREWCLRSPPTFKRFNQRSTAQTRKQMPTLRSMPFSDMMTEVTWDCMMIFRLGTLCLMVLHIEQGTAETDVPTPDVLSAVPWRMTWLPITVLFILSSFFPCGSSHVVQDARGPKLIQIIFNCDKPILFVKKKEIGRNHGPNQVKSADHSYAMIRLFTSWIFRPNKVSYSSIL